MKILITGINGLVGNSLHKLLQKSDHKLFCSSRNLEGLAKYKVDISKKYSLKDAAQAHKDLEARVLTGPAVIIP